MDYMANDINLKDYIMHTHSERIEGGKKSHYKKYYRVLKTEGAAVPQCLYTSRSHCSNYR